MRDSRLLQGWRVAGLAVNGVASGAWATLKGDPGAGLVQGRSRAAEVETDRNLPDAVDVAIVGAGIAGICTAIHLAERGLSVAVFEKGQVGAEASSRAFGWITDLFHDPAQLDMTIRAKRMWGELSGRIGFGLDYRRTGAIALCGSPAELGMSEEWASTARAHGADAEMLTGEEVARRLPGANRRWLGALSQPSDGFADPRFATSALARYARSLGVRIVAPCAVRSLDLRAGWVAGVHTEFGRVAADRVLVAGGVWSGLLCGHHGIDLPLLTLFMSLQRLVSQADGPASYGKAQEAGWWRHADGSWSIGTPEATLSLTPTALRRMVEFLPSIDLLSHEMQVKIRLGREFFRDLRVKRRWDASQPSPFEEVRILEPGCDAIALDATVKRLVQLFPEMADARVVERWAGAVSSTPDMTPVMSAVDSIPGLFVATALGGVGLTIGPVVGELVADLMTGREPRVDARPYRNSRFAAGRHE